MLQLKLVGGIWYAHGTVRRTDGSFVRVRKSTGYRSSQKIPAKIRAVEIANEALVPESTNRRLRGSVSDAVTMYLDKQPPPGVTDKHVMGRFLERFGKYDLAELCSGDVNQYVREKGLKPSSARREIATILAAFNYAKKYGFDVPDLVLDKPRIEETRERWLDEDQRDDFIEACDADIKPLVTFLFHTGARLSEAEKLQWRDVTSTFVVLKSRKSGSGSVKKRQVPINRTLKRAMPVRQIEGIVFRRADGGPLTRKRIYESWHKACRAVGISDFNPHDARHTFASLLVQKGISVRVVADLLGHSSLDMMMRYSHISPTHLASAVELLG